MAPDELREQLEAAIARAEPFGPSDTTGSKLDVPAEALIELLRGREGVQKRDDFLWLRRVRITGALDMSAMNVELRLRLDRCEIESRATLRQARITDFAASDCEFRGGLVADQLEITWNLALDRSTVRDGMTLAGATIGGHVSMVDAEIEPREDGGYPATVAIDGDGIEVAGHMFCNGLSASGEIRLLGATIGGPFVMNGATLEGKPGSDGTADALSLDRAELAEGGFFDSFSSTGQVRLAGAKIAGSLSMQGAKLEGMDDSQGNPTPALNADGVEVAQGMFCRDGFTSIGEVRLRGAAIDGSLSLTGATLAGKENDQGATSPALSADGMEVAQGMFCGEGFNSTGEVRMLGATIGGELSLHGAKLEGGRRSDGTTTALNLDRAKIAGGMIGDGLSASGQVRLAGLTVDGSLSLNGATLAGKENDQGATSPALSADGMEVAQGMFCGEGFNSTGEVRMLGATIGAVLSLSGAKFTGRVGPDGDVDAFSFDRSEVVGGMFCDDVSVTGPMRLAGVTVKGPLMLNRAKLRTMEDKQGGEAAALLGDGLDVAQGMFCRALDAVGEVRLLEARINGQLLFIGATLEAKGGRGGIAFNADGLTVVGNAIFGKMTADGEARFLGASIGGQLSMIGVELSVESESMSALSLIGATIDELVLTFKEVKGLVDLRNVSVRRFWDAEDGEFAGKLPDRLRLDGFRYESLREPLGAKLRLKWLEPSQRERHYPRVYADLADEFRRIGRLGDARRIAIANERRARRDSRRLSFRGLWNDVLRVTIGYGYRNWLALFWVVGLIGAGAILFSQNEGSFIASSRHAPPFDPTVYAVDATIPILDLNQAHWWSATGCMSWATLFLAVSGYALIAAVVAAAAGLFNRDHT